VFIIGCVYSTGNPYCMAIVSIASRASYPYPYSGIPAVASLGSGAKGHKTTLKLFVAYKKTK